MFYSKYVLLLMLVVCKLCDPQDTILTRARSLLLYRLMLYCRTHLCTPSIHWNIRDQLFDSYIAWSHIQSCTCIGRLPAETWEQHPYPLAQGGAFRQRLSSLESAGTGFRLRSTLAPGDIHGGCGIWMLMTLEVGFETVQTSCL